MADLIVAGVPEIGDEYLGTVLEAAGGNVFPERLPAVRLLRMLRYPNQRAIIWPDVPNVNAPLPGGAAARIRVLRRAAAAERDRLILDRDWAASVRRCAMAALREDRPESERLLIGLTLIGRGRGRRSTMICTEYGREAMELRGIPESARREAERRLRTRWTAMDAAREALAEARSDALSLTGPLANPEGGHGGRRPDRTAKAAERVVEAERRMAKLLRWQKVFDQVDADFPPGEAAGDILRQWCSDVQAGPRDRGGPCASLRDIETRYGLSRSTVMLYKDAVIDRVAWYAGKEGLFEEADT